MAKRRIKRINKHRRTGKTLRRVLPSNSNTLLEHQRVPSGTSARARILATATILPPVSISQTPANTNWDTVNRMRTDNDNKQQQINDTKSAKLDELERKKKLDKEERDMKRLTKEAEDKYKDEKRRAELAERELKKQRELTAQYKAENDKYSKSIYELQQTINAGEIDDIKNKNATIQAKIDEAKMLNMNRKHELDKNVEYRKSSELEQELKLINIENEALQKTLDSDEFTKSNQKLMENQRKLDLARYRNELLKKQRDLQFENERNRINSLTQLTEADYKNIENEHRDKINAAYQQQIAENEKMRANKRYIDRNEHLAEIEKQTVNELIDTEIENKKLTEYQLAKGPNDEINDKIKENIKKSAQIKLKNKDLELINKQREEYETTQAELETTQAELDYLNSKEHKKQIDALTESKKNALINQKNIDAMKAIETADKHKIRSDLELRIQQFVLNNTGNIYDQAAIATQIANEKHDMLTNDYNNREIIQDEIASLISTYGQETYDKFRRDNGSKYSWTTTADIHLVNIEALKSLIADFRNYVKVNGIVPKNY